MLLDQLRPALGMQTFHLPQVRSKVYRTRTKLFLKINRMELQLMQFDEHGHLRAPTYMPRRTRKHAQRRRSPGSKVKNKEGGGGVSRRPPAGHCCFSLHIAAKPESVSISPQFFLTISSKHILCDPLAEFTTFPSAGSGLDSQRSFVIQPTQTFPSPKGSGNVQHH